MNYEIFLVSFPFVESPQITKNRPVIAVSKPFGIHELVICVFVTSSFDDSDELDISINPDIYNGLTSKSIIKPYKIQSIPANSFLGKIGDLDTENSAKLKSSLKLIFEIE
jgi:mRNA-degrading endonuclease toxin of MazEF toxin-antitoxin module